MAQLEQVPFDPAHLVHQIPAPYAWTDLLSGLEKVALSVKSGDAFNRLKQKPLPCIVEFSEAQRAEGWGHIGIAVKHDQEGLLIFKANSEVPIRVEANDVDRVLSGRYAAARKPNEAVLDQDVILRKEFGFSWFIPVFLQHKKIWRDVLIASFFVQLVALATPLLTQAIIDKVIVHQSQSTLIALGFALLIFTLFGAGLSWVRQYLQIHTGNRVDAQLGKYVFEHLFSLPLNYFEKRPTGVIAARVHGIETIREFVASSVVTLALDLPFALLYLILMFWYSPMLTCLVIVFLGFIVVLSLVLAPLFHAKMNEQFMMGARNQAFLTEYLTGIETVKSLQLEPMLLKRWQGNLSSYLQTGFAVKRLGGTYQVVSSTAEKIMMLGILVIGA